MPPLLAIVRDSVSLDRLSAEIEVLVRQRGEGCGAVTGFLGVVRGSHRQRAVRFLEYETFEPLALKSFARIAGEIRERWPQAELGLHHRIGRLEVGDASVAIVAATAHRAESFQACRYAIERVKQIAPIWKREHFADGVAWVEGALADPDDEHARLAALARACA
jgi:molybdopterin synthase catalytic subunit